MKAMLLFAVLMGVHACKSAGTAVVHDTMPLCVFETGACFGFCPVYSLTVYQNGRVEYVGKQNVEQEGLVRFELTPAELRLLRSGLEAADLWRQPELFPTQIADAPFNTWQVFGADGLTRRITGTADRPEAMLQLDRLIIDMGQAHGLELRRGVSPHEPRRAFRRELIVLLEDGINPGNWMMQFEPLRLQLVRRLGEPNRWIIAYDEGEIAGKALQERFLRTPGVLGVDPNVPTQERH